MKRLQKGFSLIELMIVIAIIGVLALIAIPSYQTYVKKARVGQALAMLESYEPMIADAYAETGAFPENLNSTLTYFNYVDIQGWTMMWQTMALDTAIPSGGNLPKASLEIDLPADLGGGDLMLVVKADENGGLTFKCGWWSVAFAFGSLDYTPSACNNTDLWNW